MGVCGCKSENPDGTSLSDGLARTVGGIERIRHKGVVLLGPPGCGKTTQGMRLSDALGVPLLGPWEVIRAAESEEAQSVRARMQAGCQPDELVPAMVNVLAERVRQPDCAAGYIYDGFPPDENAAKLFDTALGHSRRVTHVVYLKVPEEQLLERIEKRWVHGRSGRTYHEVYNKPRSLRGNLKPSQLTMKDDITGDALMRRGADTRLGAKKLVADSNRKLEHVISHYDMIRLQSGKEHGAQGMPAVVTVDAWKEDDGVEAVWDDVRRAVVAQ
eukprot:TRINITY_DN71115_c0_g1_i1.p1 TRINITY_DN71115_c0_g1~~TRINITY_DN71115_c0_g1_i1.p1  ORF type:complete len:296 (+),score=96.31 TRINITY_DN71115_c0_g1_i1:75-890(+)